MKDGTTDGDLLAKLEEDTYGFWTGFARRPGGESGEEQGALWFHSGVPMINYNGIAGVGHDVDGTLARARAWGIPARWSVSSASTPDGFEASLAERGLTLHAEWPGMVAHIDDLPVPDVGASTIEWVSDQGQADVWADVLAQGFGLAADDARHVRDAHAWPLMHEAVGRTYFTVKWEGTAVATGMLRWSSGVAGVYGIAVRPAFRRRGLGTLATLLTVHEGARRGASVAILQATKDGFPVYEKLGFRTISTFRSWRIA